MRGRRRPSSSSSALFWSRPSSYTARKPGSITVVPLARNEASPPAMCGTANSTETVLSVAWIIWQATVRFQINSYSLRWSSLRNAATAFGVYIAEVGRIASCASCAFFDLVL